MTQQALTAPAGDLRAPFPWFGGKSRAAQLLWAAFGQVKNYVEPFAGSLATLLARPVSCWASEEQPGTETVNDLDCYLANFWRAVGADAEAVAEYVNAPVNEADQHARHRWLIDRHGFRERMKTDPAYYDPRVAGWWVWGQCCWIGTGWCKIAATETGNILPVRRSRFAASIGHRVRALRTQQALTQDELAARARLSVRALRDIEAGKDTSTSTLERLARARGLSAEDLVVGAFVDHRKLPHLGDAGRGVHRKLPHLGAGQGVHRKLPHLGDAGQGVHRKLPHLGDAGRGVHRKLPHLGADQGVHRQLPHLGDAGQGVHRQLPHLGDAGQGVLAYLQALQARLRRVRVACGDFTRVLGPSVTWRHGRTAILLDPPYADGDMDYAAGGGAALSAQVADWARENGDHPQLRIALCGLEGEHKMPRTWRCIPWKARGGYGSQRRSGDNDNRHRERIWLSPHCLSIQAAQAGGRRAA